ncbi:MAG: phosphatase PAP2 family protein [bacterium]|nr:phosphatase PAP2 family protein [bacterium]
MNDDIFLRVNQFAIDTPWLHTPVAAYATYGILLFGVLMVVGLWISRARGSSAIARALLVPVATLGAVAAQQVVVALVAEPRPYAVHPQILVLVGRSTDGSFPSDHACAVGAAAVALFFVDRRLGWIATVGAILMAAARVYAGAHWPMDVVAGLALGAALALVIELVLARPVTAVVSRLRFHSGRTA